MKHLFYQPVTVILAAWILLGPGGRSPARAGLDISGTIEGSWGNVNIALRDSCTTWPSATVIAPVPWGYATSYTWPGGSYYHYSGYLGGGALYGGHAVYGGSPYGFYNPAPPQPGMYIRQSPARELGAGTRRQVRVEPLLHSRPIERKSIAVPLPIEPLEYLGATEPALPTLVATPTPVNGNASNIELPAVDHATQNAYSHQRAAQSSSPRESTNSATTGRTRFSQPIYYFGEGVTLEDLYGED